MTHSERASDRENVRYQCFVSVCVLAFVFALPNLCPQLDLLLTSLMRMLDARLCQRSFSSERSLFFVLPGKAISENSALHTELTAKAHVSIVISAALKPWQAEGGNRPMLSLFYGVSSFATKHRPYSMMKLGCLEYLKHEATRAGPSMHFHPCMQSTLKLHRCAARTNESGNLVTPSPRTTLPICGKASSAKRLMAATKRESI